MLVLTRKAQQSLVIDGRIVLTILEVDGDRVKVGVEAPREVTVLRQELCDLVREENVQAVLAPGEQLEQLLSVLGKELPPNA